MTAAERVEAFGRLDRAEEFLSLARIAAGDPEFSNPIVSLCAQAAIAAADAVLAANGVTRAARAGHDEAPGALRRIGQDGMASSLTRLLRLKPKAQTSTGQSCTPKDADDAMVGATKMLALARTECDRRFPR